MKTIPVHRLDVLIVDTDCVGTQGVKDVLVNARYPNHCIAPDILSIETKAVEWSDDHPLNRRDTQDAAIAVLFPRAVFVVSQEWNKPPSEVCGDPPIVGVFATEASAIAARLKECQSLEDDGYDVSGYSFEPERFCAACGEESTGEDGKPHECANPDGENKWCDCCGAELKATGDCDEDHDEWDIDVHVTVHPVMP